jgi:hypothetical protein
LRQNRMIYAKVLSKMLARHMNIRRFLAAGR